ncbi:MAG: division/cell wall cluster transcriptional repressor MraZ [Acidobacteriota bacterium]|nr:MAG: division/cell wall cluster transcriptional repressor MraZ [Acidobacteriota bacterium]
MFRGSYTARVDEKGRLKIPAGFKRLLDEKYGETDFYITSQNGRQAKIYPLKEWERIEGLLLEKPSMDPTRQKFLDRSNHYGQMQQMDAQGRILIHPLLRTEAELVGEVKVCGYLTYLEVWNAETFLRERIKERPFTEEDEASIAGLGI